MPVFNSKPRAGFPGPFQSADVEALALPTNGSIKEFLADCAEEVRLEAGGVEPPLADHSPTAVEGKVLVDCAVVASAADFDLCWSYPAPFAIPANAHPCEVICFAWK